MTFLTVMAFLVVASAAEARHRHDCGHGCWKQNQRPQPLYRYERYSPGGYPYEWSRVDYYPPAARHYADRGSAQPVPQYRYERYSPGGYPYEWSRVDFYPPR